MGAGAGAGAVSYSGGHGAGITCTVTQKWWALCWPELFEISLKYIVASPVLSSGVVMSRLTSTMSPGATEGTGMPVAPCSSQRNGRDGPTGCSSTLAGHTLLPVFCSRQTLVNVSPCLMTVPSSTVTSLTNEAWKTAGMAGSSGTPVCRGAGAGTLSGAGVGTTCSPAATF